MPTGKINSILFPADGNTTLLISETMPECLADLNLDQVISEITAKKEEYCLKPFFYTLLKDVDSIIYRQKIFKDLENELIVDSLNQFARSMVIVRRYLELSKKLRYEYHIKGWHLEAAIEYCDGVRHLFEALSGHNLRSRGLLSFRNALTAYANSEVFQKLTSNAKHIKLELQSIQYNIIVKGSWVRVRKYEGETDYGEKIKQVFNKFSQANDKDYTQDLVVNSGMGHVEAQILDCVVRLYPKIFEGLDRFFENHMQFLDELIQTFDREIQFYIAYHRFIGRIKEFGLDFTYPEISAKEKAIAVSETYDIALADNCRLTDKEIVKNDFYLADEERVMIVSGPNQGGKTTFARTVGQLHYLSCLGCPVPGREARLFLVDGVFTHFEREEDIENLRGKLKDDLVRLKRILDTSTSNSLIILNEILTSTSQEDATFMSKQIINRIIHKDTLGVCVSFIDELSTMSQKTVSMVSMIDPDNPALRTFKIVRKPADGRAFAIHIAKKHALSYDLIKERITL